MIPQQQDFDLYRGDDEQISLLITNDDGSPLSLNGLRFDLQAVADSEVVLELSTENGLITIEQDGVMINISHALTAQAEWKKAKYDLQMTDGSKIKTLLAGKISLIHDITKV